MAENDIVEVDPVPGETSGTTASQVTCPVCGASNKTGEPFCDCGAELLYEVRANAAAPPRCEPVNDASDAPAADHAACPACGADIPDPKNSFCVECLEELRPAPSGDRLAATTIRLRFATGAIGLPPGGGTMLLGRSSEDDGVRAALGVLDNVSRHHALIRIDASGSLFVRDERSRNGTFVNDVRVAPGAEVPLAEGDVLRLASDVTADVERVPDAHR